MPTTPQLENSGSFLTPKGRRVSFEVRTELPAPSELVRGMATAGIPEGTAIVSDYRDTSLCHDSDFFRKCRQGRGLRLSLLLRPVVHAKNAILLISMASVALCHALEQLTQKEFGVLWPDTVAVRDRRAVRPVATVDAVTSMKSDGYLEYFILDVSAALDDSLFPETLDDIVTEVFDGKRRTAVGKLAERFLLAFFPLYENIAYDHAFIADYKLRSLLDGKKATLLTGERRRRVTVIGIDNEARLLVETGKKEVIPVVSRSEIIL